MKKLLIVFIISISGINSHAQIAYNWLNSFTNATYVINGIESTANGNVYITGNFSATSDFDPSSSSFILTPNNTASCFLAKYNASGSLIWAKEIVADLMSPSYGSPSSHDLVIDKNENIYISGSYAGIADFDPSSSTYSLSAMAGTNRERIFTSKYDSNGNLVWAKDYGQKNPAPDNGHRTKGIKIGLDSLNNVYQAGISFGNPIILKYNNSGALLWKDSLYTLNSYAGLKSMFVTPAGEIIISGAFSTSIDMDPSSGISNLYGTSSHYIGKYNTNGGLIWANKLNGYDLILHVTADASGNVYSCGKEYTGPSIYKYQFCKWDNSGNLLWQQLFGNASIKYPTGISLNCNNITITGYADNIIPTSPQNFDPAGGTYTTSPSNSISIGVSQIFIATFNASDGSILWAKTVGGKCFHVSNIINSYGSAIPNTSFIAPNGEVYLTGKNISTATFPYDDFDPGIGAVSTNTSASVFFAKYTGCSSAVGIEDHKLQNLISVSPNPSNGQFSFTGLIGDNTIQITDITGRVLMTEKTSSESHLINLNASQGIYFYKISDKQNRVHQGKLILE